MGLVFIKFLLTLMTLRPFIHLVEMCFKRNLVAAMSNSETLSLLDKMNINCNKLGAIVLIIVIDFHPYVPTTILYRGLIIL